MDRCSSTPASDDFSNYIPRKNNGNLRVAFCGDSALVEVPSTLSRAFWK